MNLGLMSRGKGALPFKARAAAVQEDNEGGSEQHIRRDGHGGSRRDEPL